MPGAAYLLSISDFEASVSSYLVGAPSATVGAVTDSNAGSDGIKTGNVSFSFFLSLNATVVNTASIGFLIERNERDWKQRNKTEEES